MKIDIKKLVYINFASALIIIVSLILQYIYHGEYHLYRRLRAILGYFIIFPLLIISVITLIFILKNFYFKKFVKPPKLFYLSIYL